MELIKKEIKAINKILKDITKERVSLNNEARIYKNKKYELKARLLELKNANVREGVA